ncbi:MAG: glycosyltransferase family 2 protein [Geminicoccaceae bacterium]
MSHAGKPPTISAVLTVYNKVPFLPDTIRSLRSQAEDEADVEYVFADDASCDGSVSLIRDLMADVPHLRVIENTDNLGPSIRLNQAAAAATGSFLYFLDGDDIAARGAMAGMLRRLRNERADFIYGKTAKRVSVDVDLFGIEAKEEAPHAVSDHPLATVLEGGCVRMALMCRRDLFLEAGGADERIFVQDESLPLRLAAKAKRMIDWQATVITPPRPAAGAERVSGNKGQLHHDAFFAHKYALDDFGEHFPDLAPALYAKAVSAYWKHDRRLPGTTAFKAGFWRYLQAKAGWAAPRQEVLAWMASELADIPGLRRTSL